MPIPRTSSLVYVTANNELSISRSVSGKGCVRWAAILRLYNGFSDFEGQNGGKLNVWEGWP